MARFTTPSERRLQARAAALASWANTTNPSARTAKARAKFGEQFYDGLDGLAPAERERRASARRRAYFADLARRSMRARRQRRNQP